MKTPVIFESYLKFVESQILGNKYDMRYHASVLFLIFEELELDLDEETPLKILAEVCPCVFFALSMKYPAAKLLKFYSDPREVLAQLKIFRDNLQACDLS